MMDLNTQRRLLHLLTAAFLVVAVGGVVWATSDLGSPVGATTQSVASERRSQVSKNTRQDREAAPSIDDAILGLELQKTLYDPPPPPPPRQEPKPKAKPKPVVNRPPARKPKPKLNWTLVGTLIGLDEPIAILADPSGTTHVHGLGDTVELETSSAALKEITAETVTFEIDGASVLLSLDRSFQPKPGSSNSPRNGRRRNR